MSNETKWAWEGGDRFSIGGRIYTGAEAMELLDRYEQQDRMKTREINLIVPENKALEAKITHLEGALREAETKAAGYKQSVEYALDRFSAIGSMSDWTESDLSDATQEARDAAGTLKRNVRLLQQPRAGERDVFEQAQINDFNEQDDDDAMTGKGVYS